MKSEYRPNRSDDSGPEDLRDDWPHAITVPEGVRLIHHLTRTFGHLMENVNVVKRILFLGLYHGKCMKVDALYALNTCQDTIKTGAKTQK